MFDQKGFSMVRARFQFVITDLNVEDVSHGVRSLGKVELQEQVPRDDACMLALLLALSMVQAKSLPAAI